MRECCTVRNANAPPVMACPVNGARSKRAALLTVRSLVRKLPLGTGLTAYYLCEAPDCDVVYFPLNPDEPLFRRFDLLVRVGSKETDDPIPVCYCFGFTRQDIWDEIRQTGHSTVAQRVRAAVQAGNCACQVKNPSGKCCLGAIARIAKQAPPAPRQKP